MNKTEKTLLAVVVGLVVFIGATYFLTNLVIDRVTNKVMERLQKEYSPSPYGPGFDPDKVPPPKGQQVQPSKTAWEPGWEAGRK